MSKDDFIILNGNKINLVPATLNDRQRVYDWCFHSETTKSHSGPPDFPGVSIPNYEEFCNKYYPEYFFTGTIPVNGRGFIIRFNNESVGFISYCSFHMKKNKSELDIWINSEANCGKGFGTDAIITLTGYLNRILEINEFIIRPSIKNKRAFKSYKKAGFEESNESPDRFLLDEYLSLYGDGDYGIDGTMLLVKRLENC